MGSGGQQRVVIGVFAAVAVIVVALVVGVGLSSRGQGGSGGRADGGAADGGETGGRLVDWPLFGRVPERTHYLAEEGRDLDPPLHEAWAINTHALLEFPPAVAVGVAFIANKYGDTKAIRLRDRKVLWERVTDHRLADLRHLPRLPPGQGLPRLPERRPGGGRRR